MRCEIGAVCLSLPRTAGALLTALIILSRESHVLNELFNKHHLGTLSSALRDTMSFHVAADYLFI